MLRSTVHRVSTWCFDACAVEFPVCPLSPLSLFPAHYSPLFGGNKPETRWVIKPLPVREMDDIFSFPAEFQPAIPHTRDSVVLHEDEMLLGTLYSSHPLPSFIYTHNCCVSSSLSMLLTPLFRHTK